MGAIFNMVNQFDKTFTEVKGDFSSTKVTKYSKTAESLSSKRYDSSHNKRLTELKNKIIKLEDKLNNTIPDERWRIEGALNLCIEEMKDVKKDAEIFET